MTQNQKRNAKLPAKPTEGKIVEISVKEATIGFLVFVGSIFVVGSSFIIIKEYSKSRRQKAFMDGAIKIIEKFKS